MKKSMKLTEREINFFEQEGIIAHVRLFAGNSYSVSTRV